MRVPRLGALMSASMLVLAIAFAGCGGCGSCDSGGGPPSSTQPLLKPDFAVDDVNPNSGTFQASVSPRQHLTRVSAWYFGHAT